MAEKIDGIEVNIAANTSDFNKGMASAKSALKSFNADTNRVSAGMVAFGSAVGTIFGNLITKAFSALSNQMDGAIARFDALNNFPKVMSNLGIGAADSEAAIATLSERLRGLPTTLDAGTSAVQRFTSANGNVKASTEMFLALNNAILAGGGSMETQRAALEQLSQSYAKGKPDMMEWRTALTAMPAQLKQVASAMGYVDASALGEALRSGKASMNDFMLTLIKLNKSGINGLPNLATQAKNATGGIATSMVNMKTAIQRGLADIMNAIGQSNIAAFFNGVASAIGTAANYIAAFVKVAVSAAQALASIFGGKAKTSVASNVNEATAATGNLANNVENVASGLGGAAGAAKKLKNQLASFDEMNVLNEQDAGGGGGGGGGAAANMPDLSNFDFDFDTSGLDKVESEVDKIAKRIKKALSEMFDFDKIGKAIKRFADDVGKFLQPVGVVLDDLWNKYLKPFISWAGNELLPAFLNALGGAINFLGGVIGAMWGYLKPFIDLFIVPIAQFAGSIITGVLNGIGNALRFMGENAGVCDLVAAGLTAIGIAIAGIQIQGLITSFSAAIPIFQGFMAASGSVSVALMNTAASTTGVTSALAGAGAGVASFGATLAAAAPVILAITGIVVSLRVAYEAVKLQLMLNDKAHKDYMTTQELATQIDKNRTDAINYQKQAMDELKNAIQGLDSANQSVISAEQSRRTALSNLEKIAKEHNKTTDEAIKWYEENKNKTDSLSDSDLKLLAAVGQLKNAENNLTKQKEALTKAEKDHQTAIDHNIEAENMEIKAMLDKQAQIHAEKGDWASLSEVLRRYSDNSQQFTLKNGQTVKRTREEMTWLVKGVADDMAKSYEAWDKVWSKMPNAAKTNTDGLVRVLNGMKDRFRAVGNDSGRFFGDGTVSGIYSKNSAVYNAGYQQGLQGKSGFNAALRIKSPSRVMMQSGGYFSEGVALGILGNTDMVANAASQVAQAANTSFTDMLNPITDEYASTLKDAGLQVKNSLSDTIEANSQTHVTVKVGEDTLIDKVIDGINQASFLQNRGVINI